MPSSTGIDTRGSLLGCEALLDSLKGNPSFRASIEGLYHSDVVFCTSLSKLNTKYQVFWLKIILFLVIFLFMPTTISH